MRNESPHCGDENSKNSTLNAIEFQRIIPGNLDVIDLPQDVTLWINVSE